MYVACAEPVDGEGGTRDAPAAKVGSLAYQLPGSWESLQYCP